MSAQKQKESWCVVIPMHNEQVGAARCVDSVMTELRKLNSKGKKISLVVVNDGSKDKTALVLRKCQKKYTSHFFVVNLEKNVGFGAASFVGQQFAEIKGFSWVLFMDSDLTNHPSDIPRFIELSDKNVECVKANRWGNGGHVIGVPWWRTAISWTANTFAKHCFNLGIYDCTNGFRCVRLATLRKFKPQETGFPIILEELLYLKKQKARCIGLPVTLTARKQSASQFAYTWSVFLAYTKHTFKALFI